jgi:hypothetical protein
MAQAVQSASSSVQFTPVLVLHAARRAEAEGKMDYALQFYRHLVEQHGSTPEAQDAREGLFRIAEWRWGEARVARGRDAAPAPSAQPKAEPAPAAAVPPPVSNPLANSGLAGAQQAYFPEQKTHLDERSHHRETLPQIARERHADDLPPFRARYRAARFVAIALSGLGWVAVLSGLVVATIAAGGLVAEAAASAVLGLPVGVVIGVPTMLVGLLLVIVTQVAVAVFESSNATLEMLDIERGRLSF